MTIGISLCVLARQRRWHFIFLLFFAGGFATPKEEEEETVHG
jgi:hypothetical protein